mmetsp:Transcript_15547/g.20244  ORF Transcript_15547/g.20244 Transcript_15547/m.20244 type:complete len:285 (+) Transcript_15547:144-998(+)|eukprot:CAMPEP_0198146972 /NCGR_PEP_ID=MMETSP1443-20131203/32542_1 /TAXON_ID=186043 /ORGANISM="Entomoneis sp., Strain CCMP2396" /LENGTH=284 /DNA_ID=CAMNT_0043811091 /DNA_START=71 /DNA_END=925 /DNA_ORIENTATION=+
MTSSPIVGGYSFYLNVVVIGSNGQDEGPVTPDKSPRERSGSSDNQEPLLEETDDSPAEEDLGQENENKNGGEMVVSETQTVIDPKMKLLMEGRSIYSAFTKRNAKPKNDSNGPGLMSSIGKSFKKTSTQLREGASRAVANRTMVGRAEKAVGECIPLVTEEIGVEMSISKKFQQGPVFVLEVDMKGCDLLELLGKVLGEEAGQHYQNVKDGLEALNLPEAKEAFVKEILPKVRQGMMDKMSEIVPEKMKLKKAYADLEIQCVALEDAEEAKWLYNFLAFMEQMK